jgi:hypothetical protein
MADLNEVLRDQLESLQQLGSQGIVRMSLIVQG